MRFTFVPHGAASPALRRTAATLGAGALLGLAGVACGPSTIGQAPPGQQPGSVAPAVGAPSTATGGSKAAKACSLFTNADVTTALGLAVLKVDGFDGPTAGDSMCTYSLADNGGLLVQIFSTKEAAVGATLNESGSEQVSGLGDSAFWNFSTGQLFVHRGQRGLSITNPYALPSALSGDQALIDAESAKARAAEIGLAKIAGNNW